jgi:hypothetical protein
MKLVAVIFALKVTSFKLYKTYVRRHVSADVMKLAAIIFALKASFLL